MCVRGGPYFETSDFRYQVTGEAGQQMVLDRATGLIWDLAFDSTGKDWQDALAHCEELERGGFTDWRLPNIHELRGLSDCSRGSPDAASDFPDMPAAYFWSSSTYVYYVDTEFGWVMQYDSCQTNTATKTSKLYIRCVRGGP
jgi:hypothetical protein